MIDEGHGEFPVMDGSAWPAALPENLAAGSAKPSLSLNRQTGLQI